MTENICGRAMHKNGKYPLILICFWGLFFGILGINADVRAMKLGSACSTEIQLIPAKDQYKVGESLKARYHNPCLSPVYLLKASGVSPIMTLQKWDGQQWRNINTNRRGIGGISAISHLKLDFAESFEISFPTNRLIENGEEIAGVYRYQISVKSAPDSEGSTTITSPLFEIW